MSDALTGEVRIFPFSIVPDGWIICDGRELSRTEFSKLFNVIGDSFGTASSGTFKIPDLGGRVPLNTQDNSVNVGDTGGSETHSLSANEMPNHTHKISVSTTIGNIHEPTDAYLASVVAVSRAMFSENSTPNMSMRNDSISNTGEGAPHNNMQPYMALPFYIYSK